MCRFSVFRHSKSAGHSGKSIVEEFVQNTHSRINLKMEGTLLPFSLAIYFSLCVPRVPSTIKENIYFHNLKVTVPLQKASNYLILAYLLIFPAGKQGYTSICCQSKSKWIMHVCWLKPLNKNINPRLCKR